MPKIVDHEARRAEVAGAVWRTLARTGIEGATIREIAKETGYSKAAVTHYFRDKEDVLIYASRLSSIHWANRARIAQASPRPFEALRQLLLDALPYDEESLLHWRVWVSFLNRATEGSRYAHEQQMRYQSWRASLASLLRAAQDDGALPPDLDADEEGYALAAFFDGVGLQTVFDGEQMTRERQRRLVDAYLERLAGPQPSGRRAGGVRRPVDRPKAEPATTRGAINVQA